MSVNYSISPMPVRLKKDNEGNVVYNPNKDEVMYYAKAQSAGKMNFDQFAEHVAGHNSKYHKGDIMAMVVEVMRCLKEGLLNGKTIQLSDLGTFALILNGPGAPSLTDFNVSTNITAVKVKWTPGEAFSNLRNDKDLMFTQVLTKKEDAAIKKQKRDASPSVNSPSDSQQTTDNSQQTGGNIQGGGSDQTDSGSQTDGGYTNPGGGTDVSGGDNQNPPAFG